MSSDPAIRRLQALRDRLAGLRGEARPEAIDPVLLELDDVLSRLAATRPSGARRPPAVHRVDRLAAERDRYRDLFEAAPGPYLVTTMRGTIRETNEAATRLLAARAGELVGRPLVGFLAPGDREQTRGVLDALRDVAATGAELEFWLRARDGRMVPVAAAASVIVDRRGRRIGIRWLLHDASDRAAAREAAARWERALRESEAQFRVMADTIPGFLFMAGPAGTCEYVNDGFYAFTGLPPGSALGDGWTAALPPGTRQRSLEAWKRAARERRPIERREQFRGADGRYRWFLVRANPVLARDGSVIRWLGVCTDIDELVRTEAARRESEDRLRAAQRSAVAGAWDWDLRTGELFWSEEHFAVYGLPADPPPTLETWMAAIRREDRALVRRALARHFEERREAVDLEFRIRHPERGLRWLAVRGRVSYDADGRPVRVMGITLDITDRKRVEAQLHATERRVEQLLRVNPVVVFSCRPTRGFPATYTSPNVVEVFGYTPEEFERPGFFLERVHPDDRSRMQSELRRLFATGETAHEYRFRLPDGSYRWTRSDLRLVRDEEGAPAEIVGAWQDITERKRAEEELARQAELLQQTHDAVIAWRLGGHIVYWNRGATDLYGWTAEEAVGRRPHELLGTLLPGGAEAHERRLARDGRWTGELDHRTRDGRRIVVESRQVVMRREGEEPIVLETSRDVTESRRAVEALRESEERYRRLVETAHEGVGMADPTGRIEFCNVRLAELLGYPADRIVGRTVFDFVFEEDKAELDRHFQAMLRGSTARFDFRFRRGDGSELWLLVSPSPVRDAAGRVAGVMGLFTDITERKRAETALRVLSEASAVLAASSLDTTARLGAMVRVVVPAMAESCAIDLVDQAGTVSRVAVAHIDPTREALLHRLAARPASAAEGVDPVAVALRTGRSQSVSDLGARPEDLRAPDAGYRDALRELGCRSCVAAPLTIRGRVLGALAIWSRRPAAFTAADLVVVEDLARRVAVAVDNARLYDELREAARSERRRAIQLRGAADAALAITAGLGAPEVLELMAQQTLYLLGADRCVARLWDEHGGIGAVALSDRLAAVADDTAPALALPTLALRASLENRPIRLGEAELRRLPAEEGVGIDRPRSCLAAPLTGLDRRNLGVLEVVDRAQGEFTPEDEDLLVQLAQMAAAALENSRLLQEAREAREELRQYAATLEHRVSDRTRALEESKEQLEAFSYSVSHDLRAPLRAIQGYTEALLEDFGDPSPTARDYGDRIKKAAARMDRLIRDLLAFSRLSRSELELVPVAAAAAVADALNEAEEALESAGAEVVVALPPSLPPLLAHRTTLVQILVNLLANAVKFVAPGVRPRVEVGAALRPGGWVQLWVADNGIGIEPRYHERIFGVFERLHGGERYPGTGVGLAIVKKGVER
ncbi:MAG TPA: PAS domain S-box protein, partial [Gemmatimonadales bacterium]|nr:PAS domain S-box protein [Gemmatimonadales bacterium]